MVRPQSPASSASGASSTASTTNAPPVTTSSTSTAASRGWRFLDTEETCHFFNTEIVVGTNDIKQMEVDDTSDVESSSDESESSEPEAERMMEMPAPVVTYADDQEKRRLDPMQTAYEDIYSEFDDLYLSGIAANAPKKMRKRRAAQRQGTAQVLSAFCKELRTGQSYLYQKRSEFLRVCFQRAIDLHTEQEKQEIAESAQPAPVPSSPQRSQSAFQFQCSRLERPIDVSIPELYPRKWPHLPYRDPREWKHDLAAVVTFAKRVNELPEGSLLYEPVDVQSFMDCCFELLREEGVDVWSTESSKLTEMTIAILVAMVSVAVRLQSFSLLLVVAEVLVRVGASAVLDSGPWGTELASIVGDCMKTLHAFLQAPVPPATYPRALLSQWKICAYQPSTSDAIATDGCFLYIYGRSGLLKIGTGRGSTIRDFVYEHNKAYCRSRDVERSWLCLIGDFLYCRSIVMPNSRVDRIHTSNLQSVEELVFAPPSKASEPATGSSTVYAMVTDGDDLLTIHSVDTHEVRDAKKSRSTKTKKSPSQQGARPLSSKAPKKEASRGIRVGDRVVRGPDWKWGAQDGEKGCPGTVERISTWGGVKGCGVTVRWDKNQRINTYRWGAEGCYDIVVVIEKPGGGFEKKPLPDKSPDSKDEPLAPRYRFVVNRFHVQKLLCVVDLEKETAGSFLRIRPKAEAGGAPKAAGDTEALLTAVHEHTLGVSAATTAWMCDGATSGCLGDNSGVRYRCERGCDFDLCDVCLANTLIGKQPDGQEAHDSPKPEAPAEVVDGQASPAPTQIDGGTRTPEEREAGQLDDLVSFWCGLFSRSECEIALRRTDHSVEDAIVWLNDCGHELKRAMILPCVNTFTLESPPNSSGLDPVLLVAGSFYAIDGELCIISPPGLYQTERTKRSIHAADVAWFFSLKTGSLASPTLSPVLLKSVPAGSPICADLVRRRILVFSGYLNCLEEYSATKRISNASLDIVASTSENLRAVGERILCFLHEASDRRWASRAYKRPCQGLQDWINQLQQEAMAAAAAHARENAKSDSSIVKARTRRIKKLRLRIEEFEKLRRSGARGYFVPYAVDFCDVGLRGLIVALNHAISELEDPDNAAFSRLQRVAGIWRGFLGDCIASDVELQVPSEWSRDIQSVLNGLQDTVFGRISHTNGVFFQSENVSEVVSACQDVLLWGIDTGLFEGLDRCDLLVACLTELVADSVEPLAANYFSLMHDSAGEVKLQSPQDCSIVFVRRVLALNVEATDGGVAGLIYQRSQVEDLISLLFKLSAREFTSKFSLPVPHAMSEARAHTPVEKGLLALFNGCAIDLLANADAPSPIAPRRRRLSSVVAEESIFQVFALTCVQTCEELVALANKTQGTQDDDSRLSNSVCGKLLPLVLAMVCNGGRATLNGLKDSLLRLASLLAGPLTLDEGLEPSQLMLAEKIVESSHPYSRNQGALRKVIRVPGATCLHIEFDPRCSTSGEADFVVVTPGHAWFHSDRVPFGENGIGDAGGCFFGSRHSGNWPQVGRGISIWGDTATIMLCSTSQERQSSGTDEEGRFWGLKCVVRGVRFGSTASWRSDSLAATEHALNILVTRQISACDREVDAPLLEKAQAVITSLRTVQASIAAKRETALHKVVTTPVEELDSDSSSMMERYESEFLSKNQGHHFGARTPTWTLALRLVLATFVASVGISEEEIMSKESLGHQTILRAVSKVEQMMVRRVQLLKEWSFLQDDSVTLAQMIERLSTDLVRLKELCTMKNAEFFDSDPKRSATELHEILCGERASGAPVRGTDYREEVAKDVIEKTQYAWRCLSENISQTTDRYHHGADNSASAFVHYLTSTVSAAEVRLTDDLLTSSLRRALDAFHLVEATPPCIVLPATFSTAMVGSIGSCWSEHIAERLGIARTEARSSMLEDSSWGSAICRDIRNTNAPILHRIAAMTDSLTAYAQFRPRVASSTMRQFVEAIADLLLDVEHVTLPSQTTEPAWDKCSVSELVWIGFRHGIDTLFAEGEHDGAVSTLREIVGRILSIQATFDKGTTSFQWKSLGRIMRIACAHVHDILQDRRATIAWAELCMAHLRTHNSVLPVQVASLRTVFTMARASSSTLTPALAVMITDDNLIGHLLERIGTLQSSVSSTSEDAENKLKDCCVVLLENEKAKLKIAEALEAIDSDALNTVFLVTTLTELDLSGDPPHAPTTSGESVNADAVHRNVRCDGCNQSPMRGYRFKCFTCANYDLCGACYGNQNAHSMDHQFVRLASPSSTGELLQPRSKVNGAVVPEATLVGSKQWMGSVLLALLEAYGYGVLCRGSSEDCLQRAKTLSGAGFAVTVMEWPDVKDIQDFYDWTGIVQATIEPGSARLSRRTSSASSSTATRKVDRSVLSQFNHSMRRAERRHELPDPSSLLAELVSFIRHLVNEGDIRPCFGPLVAETVEALIGMGTHVHLSSESDWALFYRTLGITSVLGGYVDTPRLGARVTTADPDTCKRRSGFVKQCTDASETVSVLWCSTHGLSDQEEDLETAHSPAQLCAIPEIELVEVDPEVSNPTSFFPAFAAVLKAAHKLLKSTSLELAQNQDQVAATELVVNWLRMFMAAMKKLPSLLDSQPAPGNGSGNMALLLFQLAKTSKASGSFESLDAKRSLLWRAQQVVLSDCQFKLAARPIASAELEQDASCVFGPGANGQTDLTDYVFNLYAHSSRSELPKHSGRNKLLEYWEKNVIPAIESYVAGSFKSYEMDYFFAQLREPLREGNPAAAMKIAFTLCDGHVPAGCHYPDPDTDWSALQLDDIEVGGRYVIAGSDQSDWPMEMRWTVGHSGVVRTVCSNGLVLMQLRNPRTSCLEHWWFQVESLAASSSASSFSEPSVDSYESALADLVKIDMELLGAIARKCVFSMLRQSPDQFPLVSDRQATKNHFNIVDILRMAAGAELGFEVRVLNGESDVGRSASSTEGSSTIPKTYDLMESLRYVLSKRFEYVPVVVEDVLPSEHKSPSPMNQANKAKYMKSGKTPGGISLSPQKQSQGQGLSSSFGLTVIKYRYTLIEALAQELKRSLESSTAFSQQNAFTVVSDSPPKSMVRLKVPGASCLVISFAVHPVLMDLPAGSSLEFFRDARCTNRIFGFFGDKRGLNFLPPLVVEGDSCYVRASQAAYARYKFRVDPLTSDFGLAMWIGDELYHRMMTVTLSGFELESIVSSALNSITDYLVNGIASLPPSTKGVVCQLLSKMINFAINRSMANSVPLSKLSALATDLAVVYEHELSAQKGLFSLPTQQLGELLATVEEVARLRGTTGISMSTTWWPNLVRFASFSRVLTHKRETSTDILARISCGRTPVEAIDEGSKMLQDRDFLCERMILLQKLPQTSCLSDLEAGLSRFIQHLALEECGEADDQTVLSATETVRLGVLGKVVHLPVGANGETLGYAVVDVGRHDIIPRLLLRLQKERFAFDGSPTEEDLELSAKANGDTDGAAKVADSDGGDDAPPSSDESIWSCGVCTLENPSSEVECAACGSPMPADVLSRRQRLQSTRARNATTQENGAGGGNTTNAEDETPSGWRCEACTLMNPWSDVECIACGSERNPSLVEPSQTARGDDAGCAESDVSDSKLVLHTISGLSLADLLKSPATQSVRQVTGFLVDQFTNGGKELKKELTQLIKLDLSKVGAQASTHKDMFTTKAAKFCGIADLNTVGWKQICTAVEETIAREPIKVYGWLRNSGFDLNAESNHYTSLEKARESQAKWTHAMDVQLVALARQVGSRIGVLSLMDLCPSHLCACDADEGSTLSALESRDLRLRFVLLKGLNKLTLDVLPMVNLRNVVDPNSFRTRLVTIRQLLFPAVKIRFFAETQDNANLAQSNLTDATVKRPVVTLDRRRIAASRLPGEPLSLEDPKQSLFAATMVQLSQVKPSVLRAKRPTGASDPFVAFIVVFAGENVVGEGGPYRQLFNDIASELLSEGNPLFIPTQNSVMKIGEYRDRFVPNPSSATRAMLKIFEFVGVLMGCCIRTGVRLNIRLAPIIWKMLVKQNLSMIDLEHIDFSVCESLKFIEAAASADSTDPSSAADVYFDSFTTALSDGSIVEVKPGGAIVPVTKLNCKEYVSLVKTARFHECKPQVDAMLRGIGTIVPIHLLQLCTWTELQQWVCGSLAVDVELLKRHTLYSSGMTPDKFPHLDMFWRVLVSFSEENKRRFINFAWGQDTLPADDAEFDRTHTRLLIKAPPVTTTNQDLLLPKADTCFFNIELPAYSSDEIMREKLMVAITMCTSMDGDEQTGRMDLYFSTDGLDDDHME